MARGEHSANTKIATSMLHCGDFHLSCKSFSADISLIFRIHRSCFWCLITQSLPLSVEWMRCSDMLSDDSNNSVWWIIKDSSCFELRFMFHESCKQKVLMEKLNDASRAASHKFFNFPSALVDISTNPFLLFILCCFRCLPRSKQDIFNSFRGWTSARERESESKNEISGEKCFTNWIENLCYKIYFTIFASFFQHRNETRARKSWRKILKECLMSQSSTLNYNSTKAFLDCAKHKFYFELTSHVNWASTLIRYWSHLGWCRGLFHFENFLGIVSGRGVIETNFKFRFAFIICKSGDYLHKRSRTSSIFYQNFRT